MRNFYAKNELTCSKIRNPIRKLANSFLLVYGATFLLSMIWTDVLWGIQTKTNREVADSSAFDSEQIDSTKKDIPIPLNKAKNIGDSFLDPNLKAAIIQVLGLVLVTIFGGTWLYKKQTKWNQLNVINQVKFQWKYDFFKSFNQLSLKIGPTLGEYGGLLTRLEMLETAEENEDTISVYQNKFHECRKKLVHIGIELVVFIANAQILFDSKIAEEINILNEEIKKIVHDRSLKGGDLEKPREIGNRFADVTILIASELKTQIGFK